MNRVKPYAGIGMFLALLDAFLVLWLLPPELSGWTRVTVAPGQSIWSIAAKHCPNADTRYVVDVIMDRNHIRDVSQLKPGEVLEVPTKAAPLWTRLVFE